MHRYFAICICSIIIILALEKRVVAAPSFDCKAASTGIELLICAEKRLSDEDALLSATYKRVIELSAKLPINKVDVLQGQRRWLRSRSGACSVTGKMPPSDDLESFRARVCLFNLYQARKGTLDQIMDDADRKSRHLDPDPSDVVSTGDIVKPEDLDRIRQDFRDELKEFFQSFDINVVSCDEAKSLIVQGPGHDSSFGAHCKINVNNKAADVIMCDDYMVGNFSVEMSEDAPSRTSVIQFIEHSCRPGG